MIYRGKLDLRIALKDCRFWKIDLQMYHKLLDCDPTPQTNSLRYIDQSVR